MPLSEDEQRILRQIEEQLQRDPGFGRTIETVRHGSRRTLIAATSATLIGLLVTIATLVISPLLSFACFIASLAAAVVAVRHAGLLGERSLASFTGSGARVPREAPGGNDRN
ncbi:MAG: hypothetical protein RJB61_84 [Actinomycetota bacterium]|jgi:hypothetical protein